MRRTELVPENGSSGIDMLGEVDGWEEGRYQSAPRYINTPARNSVNIVGRIDVLVGAGGRVLVLSGRGGNGMQTRSSVR